MSSSNINNIKNFIRTEKYRHKLALAKNNTEFVNSYVVKTKIANTNTGKYWDKLNNQHKTGVINNPMEWDKLNIVINIINKHSTQNMHVLNIGVGSGNLENLQIRRNLKISWFGIDIASNSIKQALQKTKKFKFKIVNILNYKLGFDKYDIVVALEILEHINAENVFYVYKNIHKCLKADGIFILSIPLNESLEKLLINGINPNAHVRIYSKEIISKELEINGFRIVKIKDLFAFHKLYELKKIFNQIIRVREPNGLLIIAKKQ